MFNPDIPDFSSIRSMLESLLRELGEKVLAYAEDATAEARRELHEWLKESLDVPVISKIEDSLLPGRYFWLIDSHTGNDGARIHTERVIEDLRQILKGVRSE